MSHEVVKTVESELRRYWVTRHEHAGVVWFTATHQSFKRGTRVPWQATTTMHAKGNAWIRGNHWNEPEACELSPMPFRATDWSDGGRWGWMSPANYATEADAARVVADEVERDNRKAPKFVRTIGGYRVYVDTKPATKFRGVRWSIYVGGNLEATGESAHEAAAREHAWEAAETLIATRGAKAHA
jgi:hypothetical protein